MDEDFYDTYLENMDCIEPEKQYTFNDRNDKFKVDTSTIWWAGSNKRWVKNIKIQHTNMVLNVNSKQNAVIPTQSIPNNDDHQMSDITRQKKKHFKSYI